MWEPFGYTGKPSSHRLVPLCGLNTMHLRVSKVLPKPSRVSCTCTMPEAREAQMAAKPEFFNDTLVKDDRDAFCSHLTNSLLFT